MKSEKKWCRNMTPTPLSIVAPILYKMLSSPVPCHLCKPLKIIQINIINQSGIALKLSLLMLKVYIL